MLDFPDTSSTPSVAHRFSRGAAATLVAMSTVGTCVLNAPALTRVEFPAVDLAATQAAITMNGTFTPEVTPQFQAAVLDAYIRPLVGPGYTGVPLRTPQDLWPLSGITALTYNDSTRVGYEILTDKYDEIVAQNTTDGQPNTPVVVFGYSQSAFIASMFDERLADVRADGGAVPPTTFVQVGNTNIPNGGLMSRFNGLGLTPWTPLVFAPTKTGNTTHEVFRQYDPFADFPKYTLNALAVVNSLMGYLLHFTLPVSGSAPWLAPVINVLNLFIDPISLDPASPNYVKPVVSRYEDTVYHFVPTAELPVLSPLYAVGLSRLADAIEPVLRPLIEAGYDRSVSFGEPTPAVLGLGPNFAPALQQSWEAFRQLLNPASATPKSVLPASSVNDVALPAAVSVGDAQAPAPVTRTASTPDASTDSPIDEPGADPAAPAPAPTAAGNDASAVTSPTAAPETAAPETAAPETAAPETAAPETAAPETAAPETGSLETGAQRQPRRSAATAAESGPDSGGLRASRGRPATR
jgi:hypothetical protein